MVNTLEKIKMESYKRVSEPSETPENAPMAPVISDTIDPEAVKTEKNAQNKDAHEADKIRESLKKTTGPKDAIRSFVKLITQIEDNAEKFREDPVFLAKLISDFIVMDGTLMGYAYDKDKELVRIQQMPESWLRPSFSNSKSTHHPYDSPANTRDKMWQAIIGFDKILFENMKDVDERKFGIIRKRLKEKKYGINLADLDAMYNNMGAIVEKAMVPNEFKKQLGPYHPFMRQINMELGRAFSLKDLTISLMGKPVEIVDRLIKYINRAWTGIDIHEEI